MVSTSILTSVSVAELDATEDLSTLPCVVMRVGNAAAGIRNDWLWLVLSSRGEFSLGIGEAQGVGLGEGRGERVPISMASSSVQARPCLRRQSSVSLSTTSNLVRWATSQIWFTT